MEEYPVIGKPFFYERINEIFAQYTIDKQMVDSEVKPDLETRFIGKRKAKAYQKFVAKYMAKGSPYKGLFINHGLGSGKTRTGVKTMNTNPGMEVIIMIPASLKNVWVSHIKKFYRHNQQIYYVSYNASNFVKQVYNIPTLNNKLIIIDESHIFFQNIISANAKQAIEVFNMLFNAEGCKYLCLSGTPLVSDPFELVPMFNLLKGKIKTTDRRSTGYMTLFPVNRDDFWSNFVSEPNASITNSEVFKERIMGLVSYYGDLRDEYGYVVPRNMGIVTIDCPMGETQWLAYKKIRKAEARIEQIYKYKTSMFRQDTYKKAGRKSSGTYKVNSRIVSNFSVGEKVEEIYNNLTIKDGVIDWTYMKTIYPKLKSLSLPDHKTDMSGLKWFIFESLFSHLVNTMEDLKEYSGKLYKLFQYISDPKKKTIKKFIYSEYRIFGTRLIGYYLTKLLGFIEIKDKADIAEDHKGFCIIDGDTKDKKTILNRYNSKENAYGKDIALMLGTRVVSAGYSFKETREIYILEPQWRAITLEQIMGRPRRLYSHNELPIEERTINTYLLIAVPPKGDLSGMPPADQGETTDRILYSLAKKKSKFLSTFSHALKEGAIDCKLNMYVNQYISDKKIRCNICSNTNYTSIIPPNYKDHILSGPRCNMEESIEDLYEIKHEDGYDPKLHDGFKKDKDNIVYKYNEIEDIWEEIGHIRHGNIFIS